MGSLKKNQAIKLSTERQFVLSVFPALMAASAMTIILFVEWAGDISIASFGLRPREIRGIPGILFFPFLHGSLLHFVSNLFPFVLLSTLIYNSLKPLFWKVWGFTYLLSGIWTWCFARPGLVIGASGWVYALLGFLLVAGFSRLGRKMMVLAGGLAFLYGGMVYGLLPVKQEISWEGHLMGLLAGITAAAYWRKEIRAAQPVEKPASRDETEAPYPYWMDSQAHFIDANRRIIPPEDLLWENGKPKLKTAEEKETPDTAADTRKQESSSSPETFRQGPWTITIG